MLASIFIAFALLHTGSPLRWAAGALLAGFTLIGFILSRTTGLPDAGSDIGNWSEGLGLGSMLVEGVVIALSLYALFVAPRETRPGGHESIVSQ